MSRELLYNNSFIDEGFGITDSRKGSGDREGAAKIKWYLYIDNKKWGISVFRIVIESIEIMWTPKDVEVFKGNQIDSRVVYSDSGEGACVQGLVMDYSGKIEIRMGVHIW